MTAYYSKIDGWRTYRSQCPGDRGPAPQAFPAGALYMASKQIQACQSDLTALLWPWLAEMESGQLWEPFLVGPNVTGCCMGSQRESMIKGDRVCTEPWEIHAVSFPQTQNLGGDRTKKEGRQRESERLEGLKVENWASFCKDNSSLCIGHSLEHNYAMC